MVYFPIDIDCIEYSSDELESLTNPLFSRPHLQVDEQEFFLRVYNVASYRVRNGNQVDIHPYKDADVSSVNLFLNGSVLGAILHQQCLLPFHGSSFEYKGKGIIICGHSGTGKSSVTAAFCQNGGRFINDDITPVRNSASATTIIPIKTRIKLWDDSLCKLKIENDNFDKIRPALDKFYLPTQETFRAEQHLDHIFVLCKHQTNEFVANELSGMEKYNILRNQIYRKVYLKGMPETGKLYFKQLLQLAGNIKVTKILRPQICDIYDTMNCIKKDLDK
ncbi:MAG: hypothetical protein HGB12_13925 [Bacteroidetes bacterium]|nr:hypothetical protein [Bacteroidota bacterium]